jgi:hypothetical protein
MEQVMAAIRPDRHRRQDHPLRRLPTLAQMTGAVILEGSLRILNAHPHSIDDEDSRRP